MTHSSSIAARQESPEAIALLAAARHLYSRGKLFHFVRLALVVGLALAAPVVFLAWPEANTGLALLGGATAILSQLFSQFYETFHASRAAKIHEEFDTQVFGLPWNSALAGLKSTREFIHEAERNYRGAKSGLSGWYPDTDPLPEPLDILLCQRVNLVWDARLRRDYVGLLIALLFLLFAVGVAVALLLDEDLSNYILVYFVPSLPAYLALIDLIVSQGRIATEKERVCELLMAIWDRRKVDPSGSGYPDVREIQDFIFLSRVQSPPVPDQFFRILRNRYQKDSTLAAGDLRADYLATRVSN